MKYPIHADVIYAPHRSRRRKQVYYLCDRSHPNNKRIKNQLRLANSVRLSLSYIKGKVFLYVSKCWMKFIVVQRNTVGISRSRKFHVNSILHEITSKTIRQQEKHFNRRGHGKRSDCLVFSLFLAIKLQGKWAKQNDRSLFTWSDENERESLLLEITVENFLLRFRFNSDCNCVSKKWFRLLHGRPCFHF